MDRFYLGPHSYYLQDSENNLTINDVSSPQMSTDFIKHTRKKFNLGINPYAYWIRFTIDATRVKGNNRKWLMYLGWPNYIDYATLYSPVNEDTGWSIKEFGRILPSGPDLHPSSPATFLTTESSVRQVTFYLRVESSDTKLLPLQIMTEDKYQSISQKRLIWFGIYYGIMLSMFLYNLILVISLKEYNRLYYLFYLISLAIVFLGLNGLLQEYFQFGMDFVRVLLLTALCFVYFWANLFAKSFLITIKHAPLFDKLLSVNMVIAIVMAAMIPFTARALMTAAINIAGILIPSVVLMATITTWQRGFRPARFFLLAFAVLIFTTIYEALVVFDVLPYFTRHATQIGSAIEVILLQLALADRIKILSQEQDRINQSLYLAREVQQNLLPHKNPQIEKLDVAGKSIYCDETGGDYYDYIISGEGKNAQIGIAIGDVAGHGISSALLMAAVRSSLRQRSSRPGNAADIISDVNAQLSRDVEESGQFMTMFYMVIDPAKMNIQWVRAGHDPGILYDPETGTFEELGGSGIALGVMDNFEYKAYTKTAIKPGQIFFLSTDGIWEARNKNGQMFGKEPIYDFFRNNSSLSADEMVNALLETLSTFLEGTKTEDDITLVIIKIK